MVIVACSLPVAAGRVAAQTVTVPGAPAIEVTPGTNTLAVTWTAPSDDGGSTITTYDLRYIETDATDKADANWILETDVWDGADLAYTVTGLLDGTEYDMEIRAVNEIGDGTWSTTATPTTADHGNGITTATPATVGASIAGRISDADDRDYFRIEVTANTDLWAYTTGDVDTEGYVYRADGSLLKFNDNGLLRGGPLNFSTRAQLDAGATYYIRVGHAAGSPLGPYTLHTQAVVDPGNTPSTATEVTLDSVTPGFVVGSGYDGNHDMFKLVLSEPTDVWMMTLSKVQLQIWLYDAVGNWIDTSYDSRPFAHILSRAGFLGRTLGDKLRPLPTGTYYIDVHRFLDFDDLSNPTGPYTLFVQTVGDPGDTVDSATPLTLLTPETGRISSAGDPDFFSVTLEEETYLGIELLNFAVGESSAPPPLRVTVLDQGTERSLYTISHGAFREHSLAEMNTRLWGKLDAGTYHIKVEAHPGDVPGMYMIHAYADTVYPVLIQYCTSERMTLMSDPWYGCQWHLNNTGQFGSGAGQDINVEEVWATNKGEGVHVAVVDTGLHSGHEDLVDNVDASRNVRFDGTTDVSNPLDTHGTNVAGVLAARDNDLGVRGVAPRATIYAYDLNIGSRWADDADKAEAMAHARDVTAIYNNSWVSGRSPALKPVSHVWDLAVREGVERGFDGKGALYVWGGGNGFAYGDNTNLDELRNYFAVTAVCAVDYHDRRASYSDLGATLWLCAPSSTGGQRITTTDSGNRYTIAFGGTSAATPIVSGVAALVRAANEDLTWRDVKLILANSARKNDPGNSGWLQGAFKYGSTSDRYSFNHEYGFGVVDAGAAVALAADWANLPPQMRESEAVSSDTELELPDLVSGGSPTTVTSTVTLDSYVEFTEFVELNTDWDHDSIRDLQIELVSPVGSISTILPYRSSSTAYEYRSAYRLGSARHLGESAAGVWTLRLTDHVPGDTGSLKSWSLKVYGHGYKPGHPEIAAATAGGTAVTVSWTAPSGTGDSDITSYDLRYIRSDATDRADANWTVVEEIWTSGGLSYELAGLTSGVLYEIQLRAVNDSGAGAWSERVESGTSAVPTAPAITAVSPRDEGLAVAWSPPSIGTVGLQRYDVRYIRSDAADKADANWSERLFAWRSGAGELRYIVGSLVNGVQYDVQVRVVNSVDTGPWSSTTMGTPAVQNQQPAFPATEDGARSVDENTPAGQNIGAPVQATDPESDALSYALSGADAAFFDVVGTSGQLRTKEPLDREGAASYFVTVQVSDDKDSSAETDPAIDAVIGVTITIDDVPEPPEVTGAAHVTIAENSTAYVDRYSATDPEGVTPTWSRLSGADRSHFEIVANGDLSFTAVPDFDARADADRDNRYEVIVGASDGSLTGTLLVTVTVTGVDEAPTIAGEGSIEFAENDTGTLGSYSATDPESGTVILSLAGPDAAEFTFTGGVLAFVAAPDFESPASANGGNEYQVRAEAADAENTATLGVTVTVTNEDEVGTLTLSSEQPQVRTALTATLTDLDGGISGQTWTWERLESGTWTPISLATKQRYAPTDDDLNHRLRVSVTYTDGHGMGKSKQEEADHPVDPAPVTPNNPPIFSSSLMDRSVAENSGAGTPIDPAVTATDPDGPNVVLTYTLSGPDAARFTIDGSSGRIRVGAGKPLDFEGRRREYFVTVTVTDPSGDSASTDVTITVTNVNEPPIARDDRPSTIEDTPRSIDVLDNDDDPEGATLTVSLARTEPQNGTPTLGPDNTFTYAPNPDAHGVHSFTYTISDRVNRPVAATVYVTVEPLNDAPRFEEQTPERTISETARGGDRVGAPVAATDVDNEPLTLSYSLSGPDAASFEVEQRTGQIKVAAGVVLDATTQPIQVVTVTARDPGDAIAQIEVTITVVEGAITPVITTLTGFGGGGGGGGPSGPVPSDLDFEWNVDADIEALDSDHGFATAMWSNGATLWIAENGAGADDAIYAYDLASGERREDLEFEFDDGNLAPRGVWSDGSTIWVSDSGKDKLFAHDLASGGRLPERDIALAGRNRDARGIWFDEETLWVLDGRKDSLFTYDLGSGELLAEYALDDANDDPRGLFFDGVTFWVSDHGEKRLFAYRLEAGEDGEHEFARNRDEEFPNTVLSRASNNSPRGIWSDGDVMYVADASDAKVYSYNMPDAIDARLASLALSGVDIGEFSSSQTEYEGTPDESATQTTVMAAAMQQGADVAIDPTDADEEADGHQVALADLGEITVTVTSADGSREKVYRVSFPGVAWDPARDPWPHCLRGAVAEGFSLVVFEGGSVDELVTCAESRDIGAFYALRDGAYVSYILGAPDFVNREFRELYAHGLPAVTPLVAGSSGPPSADPFGDELDESGQVQWRECLRGEIAEGFSLVVYEGGSVEGLAACAQSRNVTSVYVLADGEWVSYILGAPEFVNEDFAAVFPDGLPALTPLVARSPVPTANASQAGAADR